MRVVHGLMGALLFAALSSGAQAQTSPYIGKTHMPRTVAFNIYKDQMIKLRAEALKQQEADGGTLSPANKSRYQERINHIEHVYRIRFRDGFSAGGA